MLFIPTYFELKHLTLSFTQSCVFSCPFYYIKLLTYKILLNEYFFFYTSSCDCKNVHNEFLLQIVIVEMLMINFFCFVNCNSRNPSNAFLFIYAYCDWKMFINDELIAKMFIMNFLFYIL